MNNFIKTQVKATLKYLPFHIAASYFKKKSNAEVELARKKAGGFVKGICGPGNELSKACGFEWTRGGTELPFEKDGVTIRQEYLDWREKHAQGRREHGFKWMIVTPYPKTFVSHGMDPRTPEGEEYVRKCAAFWAKDLQGLVEIFQITNEMGLPDFMHPLNMAQAVRFIAVQAEAMAPLKKGILVGYNSAGPQADLHSMLRPYHQYMDYVGIDIYVGCFIPYANWMATFDLLLRYLWSLTGKPVLLCEFGYIRGGAPKTDEERRAILQQYGVNSEKEARENIEKFVQSVTEQHPRMGQRIAQHNPDDPAAVLFGVDYRGHFYKEMPEKVVLKKYPHTPEGQAAFYRDIYPRLAKLPFVIGAMLYAWKDDESCHFCGQDDCPGETRWGLLDKDRNLQPGYYAVRDALGNI